MLAGFPLIILMDNLIRTYSNIYLLLDVFDHQNNFNIYLPLDVVDHQNNFNKYT